MYSLTQPHAVKAETHAVDAAVAALPVRIDLRSDTVTKPTPTVSTERHFGLRSAAPALRQSWQLQPSGNSALRGTALRCAAPRCTRADTAAAHLRCARFGAALR